MVQGLPAFGCAVGDQGSRVITHCVKWLYYQDEEQQNLIFYDPRIAKIDNQIIGTLSYGELRYLEILLISRLPQRFILLDEPFSMIEPLYQDAIKDMLVTIKKDKGIILTDHYYFDVLQITDKNLMIRDGKSIEIRDLHYPNAKIAVLSNGSLVDNENIFNALKKVDQNILKLDSAFINTILSLNCPNGKYNLEEIICRYKNFGKSIIIQTMFVKGILNNNKIDNTTEKEISAWLKIIQDINPEMVMIYTIKRDTPYSDLKKIDLNKLQEIANNVKELGIKTQISD